MDHIVISFVIICCTGILFIQGRQTMREVKKSNKDQQEIKTRLAWVKKRQKKILEWQD